MLRQMILRSRGLISVKMIGLFDAAYKGKTSIGFSTTLSDDGRDACQTACGTRANQSAAAATATFIATAAIVAIATSYERSRYMPASRLPATAPNVLAP